ncbi:MAG: 3-methyl-2-oxobutanoate hydroxymethyltransferase [Candidatus Gastranaerophilales bacterium]|nr:3-methyl-2-oxobutanoate hydroxymethyltransferase [Candidatus Gastranaerophilales bacterium]
MRKSIQKIQNYKKEGKKITVLTAYDYSTAKYIDQAGVDMILVGDSLAQVALGLENTTDVGMEEMLIFTRAVSRGVENALLIADMPFMSFQIDKANTMKNACEFIKAGANAVKLEGSSDFIIENIKHLTSNGIPVVGHLGFTPMTINSLGGHKIQGKDAERTMDILKDALKLQSAGCFAIVLEMVPLQSGQFISQRLRIPTIGIGGGRFCDGQVLVSDDLLGKYDRYKPKFARQYSSLKDIIFNVAKAYCTDVESGVFPNVNESFMLELEEIEKLENYK